MAGKIRTVTGDIAPEQLGSTLTHEHLSIHTPCYFFPPNEIVKSKLDWRLENIGWIQQNPYSHQDNLVVNDKAAEEAIMFSTEQFKKNGGCGLVENSVFGLYRNMEFCKKVSVQTGVHVIAGTGYYINASIDKDMMKISTEDMAKSMISDIIGGVKDDPSIRCGLVGEVGTSYPIYEFERRSIVASAEVQQSLGCAVSFHPGRDSKAPAEIMRIFLEAGGRVDKTIMSHLERTLKSNEAFHDFAEIGCYCQLDLFGIENSYYQIAPEIDFPSDAQRMDFVKFLLEDGRQDRILMAHDIHTKHRLEYYGGHGFSHILLNVIPKMKQTRGITQEQVDSILIYNPRNVLQLR